MKTRFKINIYVELPENVSIFFLNAQDDAAKAVMKADGLQIGEHQISVAISNPPKRRPPEAKGTFEVSSTHTPSLGSGKKDVNRVEKPRTMLAFQPRALKAKAAPTQAKKSGSGEVSGKLDDVTATDSKKGLSNDQFRQMMFKKT